MLPLALTPGFDHKLGRENIRKFGSISISASRRFSFLVVKITITTSSIQSINNINLRHNMSTNHDVYEPSREQMAKD